MVGCFVYLVVCLFDCLFVYFLIFCGVFVTSIFVSRFFFLDKVVAVEMKWHFFYRQIMFVLLVCI